MKKNCHTEMKNKRHSKQVSEKGLVFCPHCRENTEWQDNPYRPFCSARCRSIDLGAWVEEEYRVPGDKADNREESEQ